MSNQAPFNRHLSLTDKNISIMKEFVMIFRASGNNEHAAAVSPEQMQQVLTNWMAWMSDIESSGNMASRGNRLSSKNAKRIQSGGMVTDGPYTEIKEFINGFTILKTASIDEAVVIAKSCPILQMGGSVEVREVIAVDDNN